MYKLIKKDKFELEIEKVRIVGSGPTASPDMAWFQHFSSRFWSGQKDPVCCVQLPLFASDFVHQWRIIHPDKCPCS
jgi:hypothetical protein